MTESSSADTCWTSAFDAACWINPLYYSTTIEEEAEVKLDSLGNKTRIEPKSSAEVREDDEVLGWTLDAGARGVAVMGTAVFVSSELLRLAREDAGCFDEDQVCENRVYGMRPSSILSNIVMVVGLFSAVIMPLIGSVIDHTNYRRAVGTASAAALLLFILIQNVVMQHHWFTAAILQIFVAFTYTVHLCAVYAYLPELTDDQEVMVHYTSRFSVAQYCGSVSFLLLMVVVLSVINKDDQFNSATLSQSVVFLTCCIFFGYAWAKLFRSRQATQQVPENRTLLNAGFIKIYTTAKTILLNHSAIKWVLISAAFTEGATTTFSTIAITYMTEELGFTARENGIAILLLLVFGVPGTRLAAYLTSQFNPIRSLQASLFLWIVNTMAASYFLKEPGQQGLAYFFAMIWGIAMGWVYPTEKALYVTIIPRGQEAELMGMYICACQMLSWLPPMVFSIMNESGFSLRIGLCTLTVYFIISFCILFFVGDYDTAVEHARAIDEGRRQFAASPPPGLGIDGYGCYEEWVEPIQRRTSMEEGGSEMMPTKTT